LSLRSILTRSPQDPGGGWDAIRSANDLARRGLTDAECIEILRTENRPAALVWAADLVAATGKTDIFRSRTISRLRHAAGVETGSVAGIPASVPDLPSMPVPAAFAELLDRVPALGPLEIHARRLAASPQFERVPSQLGEDQLVHPSPQSTWALRPMYRRARKLVGPRADSDDPVVASTEAEWVVQRHLLAVLEEDPQPG
jgi:hypothetical protein